MSDCRPREPLASDEISGCVPDAAITRLEGDLTRFRRRLDSLTSVGMAMGSLKSLDDLYNFFVEVIAAEFEAERVSLMRYDGSTATLQIVAAHGLDPEVVRTTRVRLGEGIAGRVVAEGKPLLVADVSTDPRVGHPPKVDLGAAFLSMPLTLSVPLVSSQDILGVINVTNRANGATFDDDDTAFISALAGQAVAVMERAISLERLRQSHATLQEVQSDLAESSRLAPLGEVAGSLAGEFERLAGSILEHVDRIAGVQRGTTAAESLVRNSNDAIRELVVRGAEMAQRTRAIVLQGGRPASAQTSLHDAVRLGVQLEEAEWRARTRDLADTRRIDCFLQNTSTVRGSRREIARMVMQLVRNSAEALPHGGTITISTESRSGHALLIVSDDGAGIPQEHRSRLFEPFFTTRAGHQGLGLSIVQGLAQRMGATVDFQSDQGVGTTVTVSFPEATSVETMTNDVGTTRDPESKSGGAILLVDPNLHRLRLYSRFLERDGHQVTGVTSGDQGLLAVEVDRFDLVIADLTMPHVSGRELARSVHATVPGVPFIFVGDWESRGHAFDSIDSGPAALLTRPITRRQLISEVRRLLGVAWDKSTGGTDWIR
ncbi:MAG: ATP-binding protein [Candidatus Eisenbacteria bacterium]